RAFCLFTSYAQMREIYERVSRLVDYPTLLQGSGPRSALLEKFRNTEGAVLFATASFWQGVDVPGDALSCVIIDRLPFAVPSDPIVAARVAALQEEGRNAFAEYQVPEAVLALLDNRIVRMTYGRTFFESLPPYAVTHDLATVEKFMRR
ncbi:MAG: ATP-dependent DNA helicase, partial [Candidatus Acidiferrales bacterium]